MRRLDLIYLLTFPFLSKSSLNINLWKEKELIGVWSCDWAFAWLVLDLIFSIFIGLFMHWVLYPHAFVHLAFLYMHCFSFWSYFIAFFFFFFFCVSKNPKLHKKCKIQKVWSYLFEHISHVEFSLVPLYYWRSIFTRFACYVCIFTRFTCYVCIYIEFE